MEMFTVAKCVCVCVGVGGGGGWSDSSGEQRWYLSSDKAGSWNPPGCALLKSFGRTRATGISCFYDRRGKLWRMRWKGATDRGDQWRNGPLSTQGDHVGQRRGNPSWWQHLQQLRRTTPTTTHHTPGRSEEPLTRSKVTLFHSSWHPFKLCQEKKKKRENCTYLHVNGSLLLRLQALAHFAMLTFLLLVRWEESGGTATSRTPSLLW